MTKAATIALGTLTSTLLLLAPRLATAQEEPIDAAPDATADAAPDAAPPDAAPPAATEPPPAAAPEPVPGPEPAAPTTDDPTRDQRDESPYSYEDGGLAGLGLVTGLKVGAGLGLKAFGATPVVELELGYLLPPLERSFQIFVSGQYAAPKAEGDDIEDVYGVDGESRLPDSASYEIVERQAVLTLGVLYRVPVDLPLMRPYAGVGGRLYLTEAVIEGSAGGVDFGENRETDAQAGFFGALGMEAYLGPGAALLELQLAYAKIDGYVLRKANATSLNIALGYRLFI